MKACGGIGGITPLDGDSCQPHCPTDVPRGKSPSLPSNNSNKLKLDVIEDSNNYIFNYNMYNYIKVTYTIPVIFSEQTVK
jgi:hypothetical protein